MWNCDPPGGYRPGIDPLYLGIPVFFVIHAQGDYLIFFENPFPGSFQFGKPVDKKAQDTSTQSGNDTAEMATAQTAAADFSEVSFSGGILRHYFIPGPPQRAFERYSELTGRPNLPPRWSLGYHHSRWGFRDESEIRTIVNGFRDHDLPLSAIHLDIDYQDGYRVFTVNRQKFPDLPGLSQDLSQDRVRLVGILEPGVKIEPHYDVYEQGLEEGHYCSRSDGKPAAGVLWPGWSVYPDFTAPHTRDWWGQQYRQLVDLGFSGLWHDMNEPTSISAWGQFSLPANTRHSMEGRGGNHLEAHNLYGLLMNQAGYRALRQLDPHRRPWLLSRSGWAGLAPYAWSWTADLESTWDSLRQSVSSLLGLSLSGVPYCGSDIGGFQGDPEAELYLRWFQLAAFTPFFRTHSSLESPPREPWRYGEPFLSIIRKFMKLRCRLIPYLYTLAWEAAESGAPIIRPLFWNYPDIPELWSVGDQFFLGDALLVAPILEPGVQQRSVRLPPGGWFSFWDGNSYQGPANVILSAPLDQIPVLVRAGSLLPMDEGERLALHCYPPEDGIASAFFFEDAGDGYGASRIDRFTIRRKKDILEIERASEGEYPSAWKQLDLQVFAMDVHQAWADGRPLDVTENRISTSWFKHLMIEAN
jgi:alpha-glucosidase